MSLPASGQREGREKEREREREKEKTKEQSEREIKQTLTLSTTFSFRIDERLGNGIRPIWGPAVCPVARPYYIWITGRRKVDWCPGQSLKKKEKKRELCKTSFLRPVIPRRIPRTYTSGVAQKKNNYTKVKPCFVTKSVRFDRAELSFFLRNPRREIYNLGMVSGPAL